MKITKEKLADITSDVVLWIYDHIPAIVILIVLIVGILTGIYIKKEKMERFENLYSECMKDTDDRFFCSMYAKVMAE